jgi:hypothetical protein
LITGITKPAAVRMSDHQQVSTRQERGQNQTKREQKKEKREISHIV